MTRCCACCGMPMRAAQAGLAVAGRIEQAHFAALCCMRCAGQWARSPESAQRRMLCTVERRIGRDPERHFVRACRDAFEARALVLLANDPQTANAAVSLVVDAP